MVTTLADADAPAAVPLYRAGLESALAQLPAGPFVTVFITHEILDRDAFAAFQPRSDEESVKPVIFWGQVLA